MFLGSFNSYVPSDRYYYPWSPYYYLGAVGADNTRIDYLSPHHYEVGGQIAESSYTEGRNGGAGDDSRQDLGEETIPNYRFFQWVLKTVKKMRKHFIPLYVTTPDDISSIYNNFKRAR